MKKVIGWILFVLGIAYAVNVLIFTGTYTSIGQLLIAVVLGGLCLFGWWRLALRKKKVS